MCILPHHIFNSFFFFFFLMFIYSWERQSDRQSMSRGGAEREGDTEFEAGFRHWAVSTEPEVGLELMNLEIVTWAEVGRLTDWAIQAPPYKVFKRRALSLQNCKFTGTLKICNTWGAWVAQSVKHLTLGFSSSHDLTVREFQPHVGLWTDSVEPALDSLSPLLSLLLPHSCYLCLFQNK